MIIFLPVIFTSISFKTLKEWIDLVFSFIKTWEFWYFSSVSIILVRLPLTTKSNHFQFVSSFCSLGFQLLSFFCSSIISVTLSLSLITSTSCCSLMNAIASCPCRPNSAAIRRPCWRSAIFQRLTSHCTWPKFKIEFLFWSIVFHTIWSHFLDCSQRLFILPLRKLQCVLAPQIRSYNSNFSKLAKVFSLGHLRDPTRLSHKHWFLITRLFSPR